MHTEREREREGEMAVVRERRHHQALTVTLPLPPPVPHLHLLLTSLSSPPTMTSTAALSLSVDSLSNLEKLSVVGHGSGGTVYKARHLPTSSLLALKVLRLGGPHDAAHEADILRRVDSPYVVRCLAVLADGGDMCFAMEYMAGGSLCDILHVHRTLPESAIVVVAVRVLKGLEYLHSIGIVHGDIKPSNLLVNERGEVKIADFGGGGTCAYMSPERFDGEVFGGGGDVEGFAGDVWGLGVVLLECYLGRFPLVGAEERPDWATLMYMICFRGLPEVPSKASAEFRSFVGRCLEREWRRRGTVVELLAHPFVAKCSLSNSSLV